jgi:hypothetical protein
LDALLFLLLLIFSISLVFLNRYVENTKLLVVVAGVFLLVLGMLVISEGLNFNQVTSRSYNQSFKYPSSEIFNPDNSTISASYTILTRKDTYTDGLSLISVLLGAYLMVAGAVR